MRRRAPVLPAGRARPRAPEAERVPPAAAREAEGAALLRAAREAVPRLLREGVAATRHHRREPPDAAGMSARQRAGPPRLRRLAPPGTPAGAPRSLDRERPARRHPLLPGACR